MCEALEPEKEEESRGQQEVSNHWSEKWISLV